MAHGFTYPLLYASRFPICTDGESQSPSGKKNERYVDPREIEMKEEHTKPKTTTRPSFDCRIAVKSRLSCKAADEKTYETLSMSLTFNTMSMIGQHIYMGIVS